MERIILRERAHLNLDRTSIQARTVTSLTDSLLCIRDIINAYGEIAQNIHENLNVTDARLQETRNRLADVRQQSLRAKDIVANGTQATNSAFSRKRKAPPKFNEIGKRPKHLSDAYDNLQGGPNFEKLEKYRDRLVTDQEAFSTKYSDPSIFVREKLESMQREHAINEDLEESLSTKSAERYRNWLEIMASGRKEISISVPEINRVYINDMGEEVVRRVKTCSWEQASVDVPVTTCSWEQASVVDVQDSSANCSREKASVRIASGLKNGDQLDTSSTSNSGSSSKANFQPEPSPDPISMARHSHVESLDPVPADIMDVDGRDRSSTNHSQFEDSKTPIATSLDGGDTGRANHIQFDDAETPSTSYPDPFQDEIQEKAKAREKEKKRQEAAAAAQTDEEKKRPEAATAAQTNKGKPSVSSFQKEIQKKAEARREREEERKRQEAAAAAQNPMPPKPTTPKLRDSRFDDIWGILPPDGVDPNGYLDDIRDRTRPSDADSWSDVSD